MRGNLLWDALQNPSRKYERELRHLKLSAEEVFLECLTVIDEVKENPKLASFRMESLWDSVFCDLRDLDLGDADDRELGFGASVIVYSVLMVVSMCRGVYYTQLAMSLINQICNHSEDVYNRLHDDFMTNVWRLGEERLRDYVQEYIASDELWLSDDIMENLRDIPILSVVVSESKNQPESEGKQLSRLTNRQQIILFEKLLNIPLTTEYTNISALSKFLSKVSGNSPDSIRQRIMKGIDYDDEQVKKDVEILATLLEPISVEIAKKMRER